jgi:hypothetical protein
MRSGFSLALVIVTTQISVGLIFRALGVNLFPLWLLEILFSFYWFAGLFFSLNRKFFDVTKDRTYIWDLKPMLGYVFSIHLVTAYVLSFGIIPLFNAHWGLRLLIAYPVCYVFTFAIPMQLAVIYYPKFLKKMEEERIDPKVIRNIALQCNAAQAFTYAFPDYKSYVCDNAFKNQYASCLFVHRKHRPEYEGVSEDAVIEIPVDMSSRQPQCTRIKTQRYMFQIQNDKSAVYQLPCDDIIKQHQDNAPLDENIMEKFDASFYRFPSLLDAPFSLAIRDAAFEQVSAE